LPAIVLLALLTMGNGDCRTARERTMGPTPTTVSELILTGPSVVRVGEVADYRLRARFSDGTVVDVTHEATFLFPGDWGFTDLSPKQGELLSVTAERAGPAVILAEYAGANASLNVTVLPENELIRTNVASLAFEHVVRMSTCPQVIDGLEVTNPGIEPVTLMLSTTHPALRVATEPYTLAPGATVRVPVGFDCSTTEGFTGTVTVAATGESGQTQTQSVAVTATIRS
jgi:hypothetical protein